MRKAISIILFFTLICNLYSQNNPTLSALVIVPEDVVIDEGYGGYHLWVKAKEGLGSVMITESTRDATMTHPVYSLRALTWNPINGNERRILDGEVISRDRNLFFLIDSTPEPHEKLGMAFHIFIPYVTEFGYPWSRNGEVSVAPGTFLNLRTFEKQFGDYTGAFMDNPFILDVIQLPVSMVRPVLPDIYMQDAIDDFTEIAERTQGEIVFSTQETLLDDIEETIGKFSGPSIDLVFAIDTTESMLPHFGPLRRGFGRLLEDSIKNYEQYRIGLVFFKDYHDEYLTRAHQFTTDISIIRRHVEAKRPRGGGDRPEAVFEALYEALTAFPWAADDKVIILIGDAPGHPRPRGRITREMVYAEAANRGVTIHTILLPP
ncbi:MAG: VWA domain-containing protein [Spirochaetaceae bacterium]|nr:VWA domain-containing protein [Spirochaetaceae bacterium]